MNKKNLLISFIAVVALIVSGYCYLFRFFHPPLSDFVKDFNEEAVIKTMVEDFGKKLKNVSILSPQAAQEMEESYKNFLTPELLAEWKENPGQALGRITSSPWPDRLEISNMRKFGGGAYNVSGKIIEITSQEEANGGVASTTQELSLSVINMNDKWLISSVKLFPSQAADDLWETSNAQGIMFQYPEKLTTQYIFTQTWPPTVEVKKESYACPQTPAEKSALTEIVSERLVDDRIYCVGVKNEGAAGSVYSSYTYTTPRNGKMLYISFALRYPTCGNYGGDKDRMCANEREVFDLDGLVDRIAQSVSWDLAQDDKTSLAPQLAECMPKSDMESYQKCRELFRKITNFNQCVEAGFSITPGNPLKCATPDGRVFEK